MILNVCTASLGSVGITFKPSQARVCGSKASCTPDPAKYLKVRSLYVINPGRHTLSSGGIPSIKFSSSSVSLLKGDYDVSSFVPSLPRIQNLKPSRFMSPPRASKDVQFSFRFPPMTKKPSWFWRVLSCIPYLLPLHEAWMYAETAYAVLHPLELFEFWTYPFLIFLGQLPNWFFTGYFFMVYLGVVRRKEWPHFFRFHVVMGMLLEISLQVIGTVNGWFPDSAYWGKIGMYVWTAIVSAYFFTVVECIRCALSGKYADVPFACDAAYIQIPYN